MIKSTFVVLTIRVSVSCFRLASISTITSGFLHSNELKNVSRLSPSQKFTYTSLVFVSVIFKLDFLGQTFWVSFQKLLSSFTVPPDRSAGTKSGFFSDLYTNVLEEFVTSTPEPRLCSPEATSELIWWFV